MLADDRCHQQLELARRDDMTEGSLARQRRDGWFSEQEQLGAPVGQHAALRL